MSTLINLQSIPNQRLTATLDGHRYRITLKTTGTVMVGSIERENVLILSGIRLVSGTLLMPYKYQEAGNFLFMTEGDELPDWQQFNTTQQLVYFTQQEIDEHYV